MANPDSIFNGQAETLDPIVGTDGTVYIKAAGDDVGVPSGASDPAAPQLVQLVKPDTATRSSVGDAAADTLILTANVLRKGATVFNESTAILYLGLGTTAASVTSYTGQIPAGGYYEVPFWFSGEIRGYWATDAGGNARVTELT